MPDIKQLKRSLDKCIKSSDTFVLPDKLENLHQAEDVLKQNKIEILKISETGTLGMEGPCLPGKPLYKYMKAKGRVVNLLMAPAALTGKEKFYDFMLLFAYNIFKY